MSESVKVPSIAELLEAGVYFGHQPARWHPRMEPYIFGEKSGIHIIDLEATRAQLKIALEFLTKTVAAGGKVLFVTTKKQFVPYLTEQALSVEMPYVTRKWVGGTITNWDIINQQIKRFNLLTKQKAGDGWDKYTKKEQYELRDQLARLTKIYTGLETLTACPQALFVLDIKVDKTPVKEAHKINLPTIAMVDTNGNPDLVSHPIPANDDALKSVQLITSLVVAAIRLGQTQFQEKPIVSKTPKSATAVAKKPSQPTKPPVKKLEKKSIKTPVDKSVKSEPKVTPEVEVKTSTKPAEKQKS